MNELEGLKIIPYDTTLRDGAQTPGVNLTVDAKLRVAPKLAEFRIPYIEGGWPDSNPTDVEFFRRARNLDLKESTLVAFGSTIKVNETPESSPVMKALLESETEVVTIFGKSWMLHVKEALRTTGSRNLEMIAQSVAYLARRRRVFYDAEHFFDGYRDNPEYALQTLEAAQQSGAEVTILCDTNGGSLPEFIFEATSAARAHLGADLPLGIHAHNDDDSAKENSIQAVLAGARQVQGTMNRAGERCGNLDLCVFLASVNLKRNWDIGNINLKELRELSRFVELENGLAVPVFNAYTGENAFIDKGGVHVNASRRSPWAYRHIDPKLVGGETTYNHSDLGGGANIEEMAERFGFPLEVGSVQHRELVRLTKELRVLGDAQQYLLLRRVLRGSPEIFDVLESEVKSIRKVGVPSLAQAYIRVCVNYDILEREAIGDGPINAYEMALREALIEKIPQVIEARLQHYKIPETQKPGTDVPVVVYTEFGADGQRWTSITTDTNQQVAGERAIDDGYKFYLEKYILMR